MADYDSDSSLDDEETGTETSVILGFASGRPCEGAISHLGGHPIWLDASYTPPETLAKCKICNSFMSLLLQLNGDLPSHFPNDERRLYVFCCRKRTCARKVGSVRVIREVKKYKLERNNKGTAVESQQKVEETSPSRDLGAALFGSTSPIPSSSQANPFATSNTTQSLVNPFSSLGSVSSLAANPPQRTEDPAEPPIETFAQKLRISSPESSSTPTPSSEPWPQETAFPPPFPTHDLENDYELLYPDSPSQPETGPSKAQYDADDSANGTEKDLYESDVDKIFLRFSDRLAHNPEQVLRYEFDGAPLLYSGTDAVASRFLVPHGKTGPVRGIPRCESCGAKRVFECQLVPGAISVLEEEIDLEEGMEWGTIILGVCRNDCGAVGEVAFREEWVGVQWEERLPNK